MIRLPLVRGLQVFVLLFTGCGKDDPVLARIGDAEIKTAEFERFVLRLSPKTRSEKEGREADLDHLQSMVDQELLLQEARTRGLDTSAVVARQLEQTVRRRLADLYRNRVIGPQVEVTPEEIERVFTDRDFKRERLFSRILVRTSSEVEEVLQQLEEGRPFEALARRFAANDLFAQEDGVVNWLGRTQAQRFDIPKRTFFSLPVGQVAEPLHLPGGWQIYRFIEDRDAELAQYREEIQEVLRKEKWRAKNQEEFEILSRTYGLRLHPEGLRLLLRETQPNLDLDLTADEEAGILYSFEDGKITVGDYLASLQAVGFRGPVQDSVQVVALAERVLLPSCLFGRAAREEGWDREPAFVEWRQSKQKEQILRNLIKAESTDRLALTEAEFKAFYEANKPLFRKPEQVMVREVWTATEARARALREEIEQGTEISELLRRPEVHSHGSRRKGGELRLRQLFRAPYPELVDAAFEARKGDVVGPVYIEKLDGYAVFRVVEREGADIRPFAQARRQVVAMLKKSREDEFISAFIADLKESNRDRIVLFVDRLR